MSIKPGQSVGPVLLSIHTYEGVTMVQAACLISDLALTA